MASINNFARPRAIFTRDTQLAPWVRDHVLELKDLVNRILGTQSRERAPAAAAREEMHVHHHHHSDWGWGSIWGSIWGSSSYSPVTIHNHVGSSSGSAEKSKEDKEDYNGLMVISSVIFFGLSFFCGKSYYNYRSCSNDIAAHDAFTAEFNASKKQSYSEYASSRDLDNLNQINHLTHQVLKKKYDETWVNLALIISGMALACMVAYGSFFKVAFIRQTGIVGAFLTTAYTLFRYGMSWNDNSLEETAKKLKSYLSSY